jgi:predicted adenylyl cyclase CyaB
MAEFEKEYRYYITDEMINKIETISTMVEAEQLQQDLTLGYSGFQSLEKYGYVCRVRQKHDKIWAEVKKRTIHNTFLESKIELKTFKDGIEFFSFLGMKPYLFINKKRTILQYKGLKVFIDVIENLGKFVEIEFQNSENSKGEIQDFINEVGINSERMPLYGDIIFDKMQSDEEFKQIIELKLQEFIKNCEYK